MSKYKAKKDKKKTWLSPTGVNGMERCPRCFWLKYNRKIYQPEGIVSRLANRYDNVIKKYFDIYRPLGKLPPIIEGKILGTLENPFTETYFYHHDDKYGFYGKLDECIITPSNLYSPVDHKTSSSDPREKDTLPAYQNQLDSYAWLLEENRKKTSGEGYLIFFYPENKDDLHNGFSMIIHIVTLKTNPESAKKNFLKAIKVLEKPIPKPSSDCSFCEWRDKINNEISAETKNRGKQEELF